MNNITFFTVFALAGLSDKRLYKFFELLSVHNFIGVFKFTYSASISLKTF